MCSKWLNFRIKKLHFKIKQKMITSINKIKKEKRKKKKNNNNNNTKKKKKNLDPASSRLSFNKKTKTKKCEPFTIKKKVVANYLFIYFLYKIEILF